MIGYDTQGSGPHGVIVLNDWLADTSTWDGARAYLDNDRFTWVFADLRGYGRSRHLTGAFNILESAGDVLQVADALRWSEFSIVGHSMSCLIALHLAQRYPMRTHRAVAICPPPPAGFGADDEMLASMQRLALSNDAIREESLRSRWGDRLSEGWLAFKTSQWRLTSNAEAVAGYAAMFGRDGMPDPTMTIATPVLAITGEQDWEMMRAAAVRSSLSPLCATLDVVALAESGHYPMQEMPALLVTIVERFLTQSRD